MQLAGREVSGIFQKSRSRTCNQCGTLGVDLRTITKELGATEKARRKKSDVRLFITKKNRVFQKNFMWTDEVKQMRLGLVPASRRRGSAVSISQEG